MSEPVAVEPGDVLAFAAGSPSAVLLVSVHPRHRFSPTLARRLAEAHEDTALGTVGLHDLVLHGGQALRYLHQGLRARGAPGFVGVLPGYYLFRRGVLLAWESGLPARADFEAVGRSALLGLFWSSLTRDVAFLRQAVQAAAEQAAAHRVAELFGRALEQEEASERTGGPSSPPPMDELQWAYDMLGVVPTASDREVHEAWRRRRMENHPDHVMHDPAEFARRSRVSADINRAREIIVSWRAAGQRRTA